MKSVFAGMILTVTLAGILVADVPNVASYQGRLTDNAGDPVADGAYLVKFSIYDAAAGGTELWTSNFQNVTTEDGLFTYDLGSNVPLPDDLFTDAERWLGITVGVDPEITPRTRLTSQAYAHHALRADTADVALSGVGMSRAIDEGDVVATGFLQLLIVDSINCPAEGYVLANLTTGMNCNHANGDEDIVFVLITDSTSTIGTDQDGHAWAIPSGMPTGLYGNPIHVQGVFPVSAGWNKFQGIASHNPGGGTNNCTSQDVDLSLLFIPQSFGTVETPIGASPNLDLITRDVKEK